MRWHSERPLHSGRLAEALPEVVRAVVRSRGHIWLADRLRSSIRWESAGGSLSFGDPERWQELPGCSLLLTGFELNEQELCGLLDSCLVTDDELEREPDWADPFAGSLGPAEESERA